MLVAVVMRGHSNTHTMPEMLGHPVKLGLDDDEESRECRDFGATHLTAAGASL